MPPFLRGENQLKVPRDIKSEASSGFPLKKGELGAPSGDKGAGRGISKGDARGILQD